MRLLHCNSCDKDLSRDSFYTHKTGKETGSVIKPCIKCLRKQQKAYVKSSKGRLAYRRKHLKNKFNLTIEQYNQMFINQNGCCAICGKHQSEMKRHLVVDHNHQTGKIRELLCVFCNIFTGYVEKYPKRIIEIKSYLKENQNSSL